MRNTDTKNQPFIDEFLPASLLGVSAATRTENCGKLVDKSGVVSTQMGSTIDQKMVTIVWDA
jgi:hypothetical protein